MDIAKALVAGLEHHQAGRLQEAEKLYRQVLAAQPNNHDALHLLGVVAHQAGQHGAAVELITRAISIWPNNAAFYNNLGEAYRAMGRLPEAAGAYQRAIQLDARQADAWSNLSLVARALGRGQEAIGAARRALELRPDFPNALLNLGTALVEVDAEGAYRALSRAVQLEPRMAAAHCNLGLLLTRAGRHAEAIDACQRALALEPRFLEALVNLSLAAIGCERLELAIEASKRAIEIEPRCSMAYTNMGLAMSQSLRHEEAIEALKKAIELEPQNAVFHKNMGVGYVKIGKVKEALESFERALSIDPNYAEAHFNLAMALLTTGDFARGWAEYEWRWRFEPFVKANPRNLPNVWDGKKDLTDKSVVVAYEQGFGDTLQFIRYAKLLRERGAREVIVFCPEVLHGVVRTVEGVTAVHAPATPPPKCDFQVNMLSLPHVFGTTLEGGVPHEVPYMSAAEEKVAAWREKLAGDGKLRVGLCWTGNPKHFNDRLRSMPPELLARLGKVEGVTFYSLQKRGEGAGPVKTPPMEIVDYTGDIRDFGDSAALLMNLDLLITVDTAIAHLAGALGREVWTMVPVGPDFRWLLEREDSPWYPTMRLYRQPKANDWGSVLERVAGDLEKKAAR